MSNMPAVLNALLNEVATSYWGVSDEITAVPNKNLAEKDIFDYVEINPNNLRVYFHNEENLKEGIEIVFKKEPEIKQGRFEGGEFEVNCIAVNGKKEEKVYVAHQCRTGGRAGFEGAKYLIGNAINMVKHGKGFRPYMQIMGNYFKALKTAEEKAGIKNSALRSEFYEMYKGDAKESIDYLLEKECDELQEWSGWYGLGATLVNVLNMDLSENEENEMVGLLQNKKLLPYFSKILLSGQFTNNGMDGMEKILAKVREPFLKELPKEELEVLRHFNVGVERVYFDEHIRALDLSSLGITSLPESIGNLSALQTIDLWGNQLTSLPESVKKLKEKGVGVYF